MRLLAFFLALESVATFSGGARPPTGVSSTSSSSDSSNARLDRLEIAAVPRATPKKESTPEPLPLWGLPTPPEQRGPSVFKLNQGRAIDVLRHDYPRLFTERPDMSIFTDNIELHDPSGKRLAGKKQYERVFDALRFLRRTTMQDAQVGIRLVADDKSIRVRWNAKLWMRDPATGLTTLVNGEPALVHIDGVSIYDLDKDGLIRQHRLENIVLTGQEPLAAPIQLAFAWPATGYATPQAAVPFFQPLADALLNFGFSSASSGASEAGPGDTESEDGRRAAPTRRAPPPQASASDDETPLERAARERAEDAAKQQRLRDLRTPKTAPKSGVDLFGLTGPQSCETSYDCEAPMVCCDLLFATVCCTGGLLIPTADRRMQGSLQRQAIPIPVERDRAPQPPRYPGQ